MGALQVVVDFVMENRAFFAFLAAMAGYVISRAKGVRKDERIDRQEAALEGVARAVEEFQEKLNDGEPLSTEDPKGLKKHIAYRVSKGREELDRAISKLKSRSACDSRRRSMADAAKAAARIILP